MKETVDGFERRFELYAAWDKRDPDPKKDYGINGVEMRWVLIGARGATQFLLFTNWQLPSVEPITISDSGLEGPNPHIRPPLPADLGYHAYEPQYEGQKRMSECDVLGADGCYYDGSSLAADDVFRRLREEGEEGVWAALMKEYELRFGKVAG